MLDLFAPGLKQSSLFSEDVNSFNMQLGYYDLQSKNSELYNPHFAVSPNGVVIALSDPDDNRVQITLHLTLTKTTSQGMLYSYQSVSASGQDDDLLIANTLGYFQHQRILFDNVSYPDGKVTVTSSGLILSHSAGAFATTDQ